MRYRKFFAQIRQRGQMLVLFALMIPVIMLFVGLAFDLGWYYLNVSRLQNAADAAALAGARAIVEKSEETFGRKYFGKALVSNKVPDDFDNYESVFNQNFGELHNYKPINELKPLLLDGRQSVEEYLRKNLEKAAGTGTSSTDWKRANATDGWGLFRNASDNRATATIDLKYKRVDGKDDQLGRLYYVVTLNEKIRHFFLPGWFDAMNATVKAVVRLDPHDSDLLSAMWTLEDTKVIDNWEYQNKYKGTDGFYYAGKWNHYQAGKGSDKTKGIKYSDGDSYRTESVVIKTQDRTKDSTSNGIKTDANGKTFYDVNTVDSINIDFRAEILKKFTTDWDLGQTVTGQSYDFTEGWSATNGADKRILFNAEFDEAFPTRTTDPTNNMLWVRIESEPIKDLTYIGKSGFKNYNSVRQITLNFNTDNTATYDSGANAGNYMYRPYCIFYTGPENINYATDSNGVQIRHSQPVVVNLNANLNAIMFFPNSAVIINGNGFDWTGFVIAKCFLTTVTSADMTNGNSVTLNDGYTTKAFRGNCVAGVDGYDNTVYVPRGNLFTREQLDIIHPNSTMTPDEGGNLSVYGKIRAPGYITLNFNTADFTTCTTAAEFYAKFASIINTTYKDKFTTYSGLYDSQITAVTFPDENHNFTGATYYVATADLYYNPPVNDGTYVKVLLTDGTTQYVAKTKLPYVKVRTDKEYFYVNVYDLKLTSGEGKGVRIIDSSLTDEQLNSSYKKTGDVTKTDGDLFVNPENQYGDTWKIDRPWYNNQHNKWKKDKLTFADSHGVEYFMLNSEIAALPSEPQIIATYRKVTVGEDTLYFKEGTTYYTKVQNNAHNANNYIIVDHDGNILTKLLPDGSTRPTNPNEQPLDDSKIGDRSLEVVYKKETFNLNAVEYSSFDVESLKRKIYTYLDKGGSVDMFFTTIRAGWVD